MNCLLEENILNATKNNELTILDLKGNEIENSDIVSLTKTKDENYYIAIDKDNLYTVLQMRIKIIC